MRQKFTGRVGVTLAVAASLGLAACGGSTQHTASGHHQNGCPSGEFKGADGQCISLSQETQSVQQYSQNAPTNTTNTTDTTTTSAPSGPASCSATGFSGSECTASDGTVFKLAHGLGTLHLKSLAASVVAVRIAKSLYDSAAGSSVTANGTFLIVALHVLNKSGAPAAFDDGGFQNQALLNINDQTYQENSHAEIYGDQQSPSGQNTPVSPGEGATYDLVFDLPPRVATGVTDNPRAGLIVGNYGVDMSVSKPSTLGLITLKGT